MSNHISEIIDQKLSSLEKSIVATPTTEYLEAFAKANHGSSDILLMQLSKNYGYKLALEEIKSELKKSTQKECSTKE